MELAVLSVNADNLSELFGLNKICKPEPEPERGHIRVRRLITQFAYSELVRTGVVPNLVLFTPEIQIKRYPPWIYKLNKVHEHTFADFGLFIENVIATAIINGPMNYAEIWTRCSSIPVPPELQGTANNFIGPIIGWARSTFKNIQVQHNAELTYRNVQGHPDFLSQVEGGTWILDVKTTSGFKSMANESYLQILAYCVLARACGHTCNFVGILLPLQRQVLWYNLTGWNEKYYRNLLIREAGWVEKDMGIYNPSSFIDQSSGPIMISPNVVGLPGRYLTSDILGTHMLKESAFSPDFREITTPIQIFLANPQGKGFVPQNDLVAIVQNITPQTKLFIHAPYIINLCSDETWGVDRLRHELLSGQQIGARGVVVHVGKYKDKGVEQGLNKMETSIRQALEVATNQCPLIIETPAGEGTELCAGLTQFQAFYDRFGGTPNLKVCIDTMHIFGAGYDPEYYLNSWITKKPGAVALVHFNDSEKPRGCRVDRHYHPGLGYIGYKRLWAVHEICRQHNIPMVKE